MVSIDLAILYWFHVAQSFNTSVFQWYMNNWTYILFLYSLVEAMYSSICQCQMLYPDPELSDDSLDDDEEEEEEGKGQEEWDGLIEVGEGEQGAYFTSAEEGLPHLSAEGRVS